MLFEHRVDDQRTNGAGLLRHTLIRVIYADVHSLIWKTTCAGKLAAPGS